MHRTDDSIYIFATILHILLHRVWAVLAHERSKLSEKLHYPNYPKKVGAECRGKSVTLEMSFTFAWETANYVFDPVARRGETLVGDNNCRNARGGRKRGGNNRVEKNRYTGPSRVIATGFRNETWLVNILPSSISIIASIMKRGDNRFA